MRIKWQNWLWLPVTIVTGVWSTIYLYPYFDPVIGCGFKTSFKFIIFITTAIGIGAFLLPKRKWYWQVLASVLIIFGLFALPLPSKGGLELRFRNESDLGFKPTIYQTKYPDRKVSLDLQPHMEKIYLTAPGDYSELAMLTIETEGNQLTATIEELRTNQIIFTVSKIQLRMLAK